MRSILYVSIDEGDQSLHIESSLSLSVDQWWLGRKGRKIVEVLTRPLPLYITNYLKRKLNEQLLIEDDVGTSVLGFEHELSVDVRVERLRLERDCIENDFRGKLAIRFLEPFMPHTPLQSFNEFKYDAYVVGDRENILDYIEGRLWFLDQMESRLRMVNYDLLGVTQGGLKSEDYMPMLLQYLYLENEVELTSGVSIQEEDNGHLTTKCERCQSTKDHIFTQYCTTCTHEDVVCDICYIMGVSRGCSLLITRESKSSRLPHFRIMEPSSLGYEAKVLVGKRSGSEAEYAAEYAVEKLSLKRSRDLLKWSGQL